MQRPLRAFVLSLTATVVLVCPARAQRPANAPGTSTSTEKDAGAQKQSGVSPPAQKPPTDYSQEPVVYEQVRGSMRYENDGTGYREARARIRVHTPAGLEKAGQLIFDYNAAYEKIEIRSVKVIKPDGSSIAAGPEAVQDLSAPVAREAPVYSDARQKHVTVPGVAVGDTVEYDVVTRTFEPLTPGQFWQTWNFIRDFISLDEQLDLNVPRDRSLKIKSPPGVEPTVRDEGDRRSYHWSTSNLVHPPQQIFPKSFKFDIPTMLKGIRVLPPPQVMLSTFSSWEEIGSWYGKLESDRRAVTPEIRAQAEGIIHGLTTDIEKSQAVYAWVARNIRYVSLSFGVGRYQPHAATEVLANRYGDCKDKATLLEALLAAEGIHADAVLINALADVDPKVPSPLQFNHVITRVEVAGHAAWLDSTSNVGPYGYLLPQLRGVNALVVSTNPPSALIETPKDITIPTVYSLEMTGSVQADGKMDLTLGFDTRGDLEVLARTAMLMLTPGQLGQIMQQAAEGAKKGRQSDVEFKDLKSGDPTDTTKPFHIEVHISGNLGKETLRKGAKEDGDPRGVFEGLLKEIPALSLLPGVESKTDKQGKIEQQEVELGGPKEYALRINVTIPPEMKPKSVKPFGAHITKEFAEYELNGEWKGATFHGLLRLNLRVPEVPRSQVKEYAAFVTEVTNSIDSVKGKADSKPDSASAGAPAGKTPPEAATNYSKALDEIKHGSWGNAAQLLEPVVKSDPDNADAWLQLGRARMNIRMYPDAEVAFRKYLALAPNERLAYSNLAWCLSTQRKDKEVVELLEKRVASTPDDGDARYRLGYSYLRLIHGELAVKNLEKAVSLMPSNPSAQFGLGQAYLLTHENSKAVEALGKAIDLSGLAFMRNDAAYVLSEKNVGLDSAEKWANQAIEEVEIELNQTTLRSIGSRTTSLTSSIGAYWDTLAWIKFQQGNFAVAEKYLQSAWELTEFSTAGYHLARAYEAQGRSADAVAMYVETLATLPPSRNRSDDEKDARVRLASLLGGDSLIDARIADYRSKGKGGRSIPIQNSAAAEGIGEFILIVGPESKVVDIEAANPASSLSAMADSLRVARVPQSLPDKTIEKLPMPAMLSCPRSDQPCTFALMPVSAAARVFAAISSSSGNP